MIVKQIMPASIQLCLVLFLRVREAAITGLVDVTLLVAATAPDILLPDT